MIRKAWRYAKERLTAGLDVMLGGKGDIPTEKAAQHLHQLQNDPCSSCYTENLFAHAETNCDLSVILPAYNSEKWVRNAMDSILAQQTQYSFEVIAVNDGSTDKTGEILETYRNNRNVRIIRQENLGFSGARNTGMANSRGRYLMFVDADDSLCPGAIEVLMSCAFKTGADVVAGNYLLEYPSGKKEAGSHYTYEEVTPLGTLYGQPWGKVYVRELFAHLQYPAGYWFEDSIFAQIVWPMCKKCFTIPQNVYQYFQNQGGITRSSKGHPKSLDSYYITKQLLADKAKFGLTVSEQDYAYFLRMIRLTYVRTRLLDRKTRQCLFALQRELWETYFASYHKEPPECTLENALAHGNYRGYVIAAQDPHR